MPVESTQDAPPPVATAGTNVRQGIGGADVVVVAAMSAACVGLGVALHLQAGLGTISSAGFAAVLFVLVAFIHVQRLRIQSLRGSEPNKTRFEPSLDSQPTNEAVLDVASTKLAAVAAALRQGDAGSHRGNPAPQPVLEAPSVPVGETEHGWGEPAAVDALVRQYAQELDRQLPQSAAPKFGRLPRPQLQGPQSAAPAMAESVAHSEGPLAAALRKAAAGEIEIHLQPIVAFGDRKARMYEVFPKIAAPNGKSLTFDDYGPEAEQLGLAVAIERASLLRCCDIQRRLSERGRARAMIFRISSAAIRDRVFLERLVAELRPDPLLTDLLIFEIDQREIEQGDGVEREGMELLAAAGFRFALGSAETLALDVGELSMRRISYVRVTPSVLGAEQNPAAVTELRNGGIETIAMMIVREEDVRVARAFGLVLGQGGLFSEPKPLRADVVDAAQAPAATKPGRRTRAA